MQRLACVDLPCFAVQILARREPSWRGCPIAVVDKDKPQGLILAVNEAARACGVLPGQRHAAALSLSRELRAGEVDPRLLRATVTDLVERLVTLGPRVEAADEEPGVFWVDAGGLARLEPSLGDWGGKLRSLLADAGFQSTVVVGWTRFGTYAVSRVRPGRVTVFADVETERAAARTVPLARLDVEPHVRDDLAKLAVRDVAGLLALPPVGLRRAFGARIHELHRLASGALAPPLNATAIEEPIRRHVDFDFAENDSTRLLFEVKRIFDGLLRKLASRCLALVELELAMTLETREQVVHVLRTAAPTLDAAQVLDLVRLRLDGTPPPAGVTGITVELRGAEATAEQLRLFAARPRRDPAAAARTISQLKALYGDGSVVRAVLRDGHLPEACFSWEPIHSIAPAREARRIDTPPLVRRIHAPAAIDSNRRDHWEGWHIGDPECGAVERASGPYVVSGGWWASELRRDYHFLETARGDVLWVYWDAKRRRWFQQGRVE